MKVIELYNKLCEIIPTSLSCPWDKDGLESCPEPDREVKKVLITLDITNAAIDRAIEGGFDVIVSHHPVFFGGLGVMNALTFDGAKAVRLAKNNIAAMSFHTRLDAREDGVNDTLARLCALKNIETECSVHPIYKEKILKATDLCTMVTGKRLGHPVRSLRTKFAQDYFKAEYGGMPDDELENLAVGALRLAVQEGDLEHGCFLAGQIAAMVKREQPAAEIIKEIMDEAEPILKGAAKWVE